MPAELAVIIVSWNTRELTLDALRTLFADLDAHGPQAEVWVVDNASTDGSPAAIRAAFPRVHMLACHENLGFAGGNNHALRELGFSATPRAATDPTTLPRAVYLLNSDTRTHSGATRALFDALFQLPRAGVVGARLEYADGTFQHSAFGFPGISQLVVDLFPVPGRLHNSRLNGRYPLARYAAGAPFPVDHTLGATMMLRREAILATGLFDEQFFMYCEEIDWSMRIRRAGWEIYTVPRARVTHLAGQSTQQVRPQSVTNLWRSRLRLYDKHYSRIKRQIARRLIGWGMRRKQVQAQQALAAGELSPAQHADLLAAYRTVRQLCAAPRERAALTAHDTPTER